MNSTTDSPDTTFVMTAGIKSTAYWYPIYASYIVGTMGVLANGFVLVVLFGFAKLKSLPCTHLVIHQTITDTICSALLLLGQTLKLTVNGSLRGWWGHFICKCFFTDYFFWTAFNASSFSLVGISLERYLMVVKPVFHRNHFSKAVVAAMIILDWVAGAAMIASITFTQAVEDGACVYQLNGMDSKAASWSNFNGTFFIPTIILIYCCSKVISALWKRTKAVHTENQEQSLSSGQINITVTMIAVVAGFVVCQTPFQFYANLAMVVPNMKFSMSTFDTLLLLCLVNCCINPFIYAVKFKAFRQGVRAMLKRSAVQEFSSAANSAAASTRETHC